MKLRLMICAAFVLCAPMFASAQISWSGIYDFEISKGGTDSRPGWNQLPNDYIQFSVRNLRLFVDAAVDNNITLSVEIATNRQSSLDPRFVDLELAYATFWNLAGNSLNISVGKILTPFGGFTRRQLSPDNPLIGNPLFFYYQTNVSPVVGYLNQNNTASAQSTYGGSLSTIYQGGYFVGASAFGSFADDLLEYNVAIMNAPLSSPTNAVNFDREPSIQSRIALRPAIWCTLGLSWSSGSFIDHSNINQFLDSSGGTERFKQNTIGTDVRLSYLYYEINAEYIHNQYNAPYIVYTAGTYGGYASGVSNPNGLDLTNDEILVDVKVDAPFYPGLFFAGRYNTLTFGKIVDPDLSPALYGRQIRWDDDVAKYAIGIGYKPAHNVIIKLNYETTRIDVNPRPRLDVFAAQLSVTF